MRRAVLMQMCEKLFYKRRKEDTCRMLLTIWLLFLPSAYCVIQPNSKSTALFSLIPVPAYVLDWSNTCPWVYFDPATFTNISFCKTQYGPFPSFWVLLKGWMKRLKYRSLALNLGFVFRSWSPETCKLETKRSSSLNLCCRVEVEKDWTFIHCCQILLSSTPSLIPEMFRQFLIHANPMLSWLPLGMVNAKAGLKMNVSGCFQPSLLRNCRS
jgi:hypothetical protein